MVLLDAIGWWYGWGWLHLLSTIRQWLSRLASVFSVRQMLRTLLAPWKEDRTQSGQGLDGMMRALVSNGIARLVGFGVRLMFLLFYLLASLGLILGGGLLFLLWPLMPFLPFLLLIYGLTP